jgi:predicted nucleic acid-binding protein
MALYYIDASALVKRYSTEAGGAYVRRICDPAAGHIVLISRITTVEVVTAFCRKAYQLAPGMSMPEITTADRDLAIARFRQDIGNSAYAIIPVTPDICTSAGNLSVKYRLRAYDAVQLATALVARNTLAGGGAAPLAFLAADTRLLGYASAEGLTPENPANMP